MGRRQERGGGEAERETERKEIIHVIRLSFIGANTFMEFAFLLFC